MELIPIDHSQFKDSRGCYRTVSLFLELNRDDVEGKHKTFFTIKDRNYKGHTSLRKMYLDMGDTEEYRFAQKAFGSWDHWTKLCDLYWFKPIITEWRKELQLKHRSEQLHNMRELAKRNDAIGLAAARALLAYNTPKSRGRPSKEELAGERKRALENSGDTQADAERLGVVVPFMNKDIPSNG